jgi:gas vesicle protein
MSNRDGFSGGFWLGTLVGGVVGGIVGASIANQRANRIGNETESGRLSGEGGEKRPFKSSRNRTTDRMEMARRSLDDKISDLNNAIDSVRSSIGTTPGDAIESSIDRLNEELKTQQPIDAQS